MMEVDSCRGSGGPRVVKRSLAVATAVWVGAQSALAEPPLSPAAREAQQRVVLAAGAVLLVVLIVLALVTALILRRVLRPRLPFAALGVIAFADRPASG